MRLRTSSACCSIPMAMAGASIAGLGTSLAARKVETSGALARARMAG